MKDWVMPENDPLLFRHRHYTHIQVDRQKNNTVLLLSLGESTSTELSQIVYCLYCLEEVRRHSHNHVGLF